MENENRENEIKEFFENCKSNYSRYKFKVKEIETENGKGYVVRYGPSGTPDAGAFIISDTASLEDLNSIIELKPATGKWNENKKASPTIGKNTYSRLLAQVEKGDFSAIPSNALINIPVTYENIYADGFNIASDFMDKLGNNVEHIGELGFSGSGGATLQSAATSILSDKYPDATYKCVNLDVYNQEVYLQGQEAYTDEEIDKITSKLEVINFIPDAESAIRNIGKSWGRYDHRDFTSEGGSASMFKNFVDLETNGYNSYIYEVASPFYDQYQHDSYLGLGLYGTDTLDYLAGNVDHISNVSDKYGLIGDRKVLNLETGEYDVSPYTMPNLTPTMPNIKIESQNDFVPLPNPINYDLVNRISNLSNLTISEGLRNRLSSTPAGQQILSDLEFVTQSMNTLRACVSSVAAAASGLYAASSVLPDKINNIVQKYYSYLIELMNSISDESLAVVSIAEGIADMDSYLQSQTPGTETPSVTNGGLNGLREVSSGDMTTENAANRPSAPLNSNMTPVDYSRYTKKKNGDDTVYTYYDKKGNVIGETVTSGSNVKSSYYNYTDENGNTVRVNYDASTDQTLQASAVAGAAAGAAASELDNKNDVSYPQSADIIEDTEEDPRLHKASSGEKEAVEVTPKVETNTENNRGNVNIETVRNDDGTYKIIKTYADGKVTEENYDVNGNFVNSVTHDKDSNVTEEGKVVSEDESATIVQNNKEEKEEVVTETPKHETEKVNEEVTSQVETNTENNRGNVNIETTRNDDGTYKIIKTYADGKVTEENYDVNGNFVNSVTHDKGSAAAIEPSKENGSNTRSTVETVSEEKAQIVPDSSDKEKIDTQAQVTYETSSNEDTTKKNEEVISERERIARAQAEQEAMWEEVLGDKSDATIEERTERILASDGIYQSAIANRQGNDIASATSVTQAASPTSVTNAPNSNKGERAEIINSDIVETNTLPEEENAHGTVIYVDEPKNNNAEGQTTYVVEPYKDEEKEGNARMQAEQEIMWEDVLGTQSSSPNPNATVEERTERIMAANEEIAAKENEEFIKEREHLAQEQAEQEIMWEQVLGTQSSSPNPNATVEERTARILNADTAYQEALANRVDTSVASDTVVVSQASDQPVDTNAYQAAPTDVVVEEKVVEAPPEEVKPTDTSTAGTQGGSQSSSSGGGRNSGGSYGGGSYGGGSMPSRTPSTPIYNEPIKPVETVKPIEDVKPTETTTHIDNSPKTYNYYSTPARETSIPKLEIDEPVTDDIIDEPIDEIPMEDEPVITPVESKESNKRTGNAGKILGTIAGVAAAGAGMAGLAYGANKLMNDNDEEDEEVSEENDDE